MASALHTLGNYDPENVPDASGYRFAIVVSSYHDDITDPLLEGCHNTLVNHGAAEGNIRVVPVPGAFELVGGAQSVLSVAQVDAVICLGCVIKGDTDHYNYINHSVAQGIMQLQIEHNKPVIFGLLTTHTHQQAAERAGGRHGNKGIEAAVAGIKMAVLYADR